MFVVKWRTPQHSHLEDTILNVLSCRFGQALKPATTGQICGTLTKTWVTAADIDYKMKWADIPKTKLRVLLAQLTEAEFEINGKSTFKEEFVTCGGVALSQINFKTMESKIHKNLFFAGEILDIDAITGGFNFQAAWTCGWLAGQHLGEGEFAV